MWSEDEERYLEENYPNRSASMIAKELDKTRNAIYQKAHAMNLESKRCGSDQKWTEGEVEKLKSCYPTMATSDLAEELNRTEKSVRSKATSLAISKKKELTEEEKTRAELLFEKGKNVEEIAKKMNLSSNLIFNYLCEKERLEKMYNEDNLSQKKIGERFSRGQPQISDKMKEYGIETKSHDTWSDEEEEILSEKYLEVPKNRLLSLFPKRTWKAIKSKALKLGLARTAEEYRKSEEVKKRLKSFSEEKIIQVKFEKTDVLSYILGVFDGDGYHDGKYTIGLEVNSKEFADKFYLSLEEIGLNPGRGKREDREREVVWSSSIKIIEWYKKMDRKEKLKWLLEEGNGWRYIEGRYESDGNIHPSGSPRITSTNKKEIKFISKILLNLKIDCSVQKDNVWISKKDAEKFFGNINPVIKSKSPNDSGKEVINR